MINFISIRENYLNEKYEFKFNEITKRTYYKVKGEKSDFILLDSYKRNSIKRELDNNNIPCTASDLKCLLNSDFVNVYNPIADYFNNLPKWDGKDYIKELSNTVESTNQVDFEWAFKKWIVATVACALYDNVSNQTVLILTGRQGIGKTTWLKSIVPEPLKEYFFSGNINPNNKDTTLLLSEKLIINLDELVSLNKKQIESLKELITKDIISERRAYGEFTENYVRRASFVGSSNHNEILMDVTGNRRFLCFEVNSFERNHNINIDKVFSQVMHLLNTDFKYYFDLEDINRLEKNNEMFVQSSEENDWIEELFSLPENDAEENYLNATEIIELIKKAKKIFRNINVQEVGKLMTSKGYRIKKIKGSKKYIVKIN